MAADYEESEIVKPKNYNSWSDISNTRQESEISKLFEIKGFPFPIDRSNKKGFFYKAVNHEVIKSDLLQLLLTEPGERIMLPTFGTGLRRMIFEQKGVASSDEIRSLIINAIEIWEPRIVVYEITVESNSDDRIEFTKNNISDNAFIVSIAYSLKENLQGIQNLVFRINYNESSLS